MAEVLFITGGPDHAHDFDGLAVALGSIIDEAHVTTTVWHPDDAVAILTDDATRPDVVVINALRWQMSAERYAPWRDRWGYVTSPEFAAAMSGFVADGGGLFANHTASICFDDWPHWGQIVGGSWNWERSSHPEPHRVKVQFEGDHPVTAGLGSGFEIVDEVYGDLDLQPDIEVLGRARRFDDDEPQPVIWAHRYGEGRVLYDGFGHDAASVLSDQHSDLIRRALRWVAGEI
jgi:type 1 glutamine amidotransferase